MALRVVNSSEPACWTAHRYAIEFLAEEIDTCGLCVVPAEHGAALEECGGGQAAGLLWPTHLCRPSHGHNHRHIASNRGSYRLGL